MAVFSPGPFRVAARYAFAIVSESAATLSIRGSILGRALFFFFFFFFFFFPFLLFFFSTPLLFLPLSLSARWFNTYQIQILFLSLFFFFPSLALFFPFFSSSNFPLAFLLFFFLLFFSHSIPSSCFLFFFFPFLLLFFLSFLPFFISPTTLPYPPLLLQKILGRLLTSN